MRGWHTFELHGDTAAPAPTLTVLRLGLDLLAEATEVLAERDLSRLRSIVAEATDRVGCNATADSNHATGETAARTFPL